MKVIQVIRWLKQEKIEGVDFVAFFRMVTGEETLTTIKWKKWDRERGRERGSAEMQNCRLQIDDIDMIWCKACEEGSSQNPSMTRQNLIPSIFLLIFDFDRWMDGWMGLLEVMRAWCACFIISIHHLANSNTKQIIQMLYILVTKREEKKKKSKSF